MLIKSLLSPLPLLGMTSVRLAYRTRYTIPVQPPPINILKRNKETFEPSPEETFEPRHEKTNILVSYLVQHKPGCTVTGDG